MSQSDKLRLEQIRKLQKELEHHYLKKQQEESDPIGDILFSLCKNTQPTPHINLDKEPVPLDKPIKKDNGLRWDQDAEHRKAYQTWYQQEHGKKFNKIKLEKYHQNIEAGRKRNRDQYYKHREKRLAQVKIYQKTHPEKQKIYQKKYRKKLKAQKIKTNLPILYYQI